MIKYKPNTHVFTSYVKPLLKALSPLVVGLGIVNLAKLSPAVTEAIYSQRIFPIISAVLSTISSILPFSVAETLLYGAVIATIVFIIYILRQLVIKRGNRLPVLYKLMLKAIFATSLVFLCFTITTAPNYYRLTFYQQSQLKVRDASVQELVALCEELIHDANQNITTVERTPEGHMLLDAYTAQNARTEFNKLSAKYSFIPEVYAVPKPVGASYIMSLLKLTGFYFPYTIEANYNNHMLTLDIPTTMSHELAHTAGFMREDEANYLAYITCRDADLPEFRYSASIMGITYSMNALYSENYDEFMRLYSQYDPQLAKDLQSINAYWKQFDTPIAEVSDTVNDAYLKLNQQTDGTKSYGRVLDLMLADYRARHNID